MRPSGKADERGPTSGRNERRVSDQLPAIGSFRFPRVAMLAFGRKYVLKIMPESGRMA